MRPHIVIIFLLFLISCGSSKEEKVESAVDLALTYLSSEKCDEALKALKEAGQSNDPVYLQVLSSAYGCKAGVDVVEVITELDNFDSTKVLNEISTKEFAHTTSLTEFNYLTSAVNTLVNSTSSVSQNDREAAFGVRKGQDMGMQLLLYSVVQVSKFVNYFGNTATGSKGDGDGINNCFLDYTQLELYDLLATLPSNNCSYVASGTNGHPDLVLSTSVGRTNACHGIILINNVLDIVENIDVGDSKNLKVLKDISGKISTLRNYILTVNPDLEGIFEIRDQASCQNLSNEDIEIFIFALYEVGFE